MATNTTHFQYILPDVGGDDFAWGTMNNDNWIKADAQFKAINDRTISTSNGLTGGGNLSANRTFGLTGQALALHNHAANGILARTGAAAYASRSFVGGAGISVTNSDGVAGNPTIAVDGTVARKNGSESFDGSVTAAGFFYSDAGVGGLAHYWGRVGGVPAYLIYGGGGGNLALRAYDPAGTSHKEMALNGVSGILSAPGFAGAGAGLTNLNADNLAAGTVADARLPSTVARRNTNNTFSGSITADTQVSVTSAPTGNAHYWFRTSNGADTTGLLYINQSDRILRLRTYTVGGAFAEVQLHPDGGFLAPAFHGNGAALTNLDVRDAATGSIGSYALLRSMSASEFGPGATTAGSNLRYANSWGTGHSTPGGTWRAMGWVTNTNAPDRTTLWLRIS